MNSERTAAQWLRSVIAYLEWRAGKPWRRITDPIQRNANERLEYLDAARLVRTVYYAPEPCAPFPSVAISPDHPHGDDPRVGELCLLSRAELAARLMDLDGRLTDRKILSHLPKAKLAGMILDREPERRTA